MTCDDVLRAVFDSQLEASLDSVGGTGEIAVTRAAHRPERGEMFDARLGEVKESSEPIKLLLHWKRTRFSFAHPYTSDELSGAPPCHGRSTTRHPNDSDRQAKRDPKGD